MIYLPDTNACIKYINQKDSTILQKFAIIPRQDIVLCDIVKLELYYGAYNKFSQNTQFECVERIL